MTWNQFYDIKRKIKDANYLTYSVGDLCMVDFVHFFTIGEANSYQDMIYNCATAEIDLVFFPSGWWQSQSRNRKT
jgi:hypothetical protein